jgi:hypothetical protein
MFQANARESIQKLVANAGRVEGLSVDVEFENREHCRGRG